MLTSFMLKEEGVVVNFEDFINSAIEGCKEYTKQSKKSLLTTAKNVL